MELCFLPAGIIRDEKKINRPLLQKNFRALPYLIQNEDDGSSHSIALSLHLKITTMKKMSISIGLNNRITTEAEKNNRRKMHEYQTNE